MGNLLTVHLNEITYNISFSECVNKRLKLKNHLPLQRKVEYRFTDKSHQQIFDLSS